jgi:putative sigma-54 modulation protein
MLMTIEYTGRQTTLTAKLKAQAEAGIQRIDRVTNRCTKAHVILTEEKHRRIAEVSVQCRDNVLVATCEATEMESALRAALVKVEKQAIHHKERNATVRDHAKPLSVATATL